MATLKSTTTDQTVKSYDVCSEIKKKDGGFYENKFYEDAWLWQ